MTRSRRDRTPPEPPGGEAAMEIAARFLATRPRTRFEIERRLKRAGADETVVAGTLDRLAALGYVDDEAFVRWWAEQRDRHAPRGRRLLEAELRQRGVGRDAMEALREHLAQPERAPGDDHLPASDAERASLALDRHLRGRPVPDDRRAHERLGMFLVRRGFDPETARAAIRAAMERVAEPDEVEAPDP